MKEQQAREEMAQQKEELEKRLTEFQDEANRSKEALVNIFNLQSWKSQSCCRLTSETVETNLNHATDVDPSLK